MAGYKAFISYNHTADGRLAPVLQSPLDGHASTVVTVELSPRSDLLATATEPTGQSDARIHLWDARTRRPVGPPLPGRRLAFSPDGRTLATDDEGFRRVVIWDLESRTPREAPLDGHTGSIRDLACTKRRVRMPRVAGV